LHCSGDGVGVGRAAEAVGERVAEAADEVRVRAAGEQRLDDLGAALLRGQNQRRLGAVVDVVDLGPGLEQSLNRLQVPGAGGLAQRPTVGVAGAAALALLQDVEARAEDRADAGRPYKALSPGGNPKFGTVMKVTRALKPRGAVANGVSVMRDPAPRRRG
jgi:hypothetical protein